MNNRSSLRRLTAAAAILLAPATAASLAAQDRSPVVQQAIEHRDAGQFDAAVRLLGPYVARTPDDVEAARVLAQSLYWLKRPDDARAVYEATLRRHPDAAALVLDFGRMLAETGDRKRARALAMPLAEDPTWGARARALLGTVAYWDGDFTKARRLLRSVVQADPSQEEARRQLGEIAAVTAPWILTGGELRADDQPLVRRDVRVAAGVHATPLLSLTARAGMRRVTSADSLSLDLRSVEAGVAHFAPALRLETDVVAGLRQRDGDAASWTGRGRAGLRLPRHLKVHAMMERDEYLHTVASLRTSVMTNTTTALVTLDAPHGWLGEAAVQHTAFPDDNAVRTVYAWVLVPLTRTGNARFQMGYGLSLQHADESRFVLADSTQPYPPGDPRFDASGVYAPYYTPAHLAAHSVLANWETRTGVVTLRAGGSYAVWATDDEPVFTTQPGDPVAQFGFTPRALKAWTVRGGMDIAASPDVTIVLGGEATQAAFYRVLTARAGLSWRFASAAARRATQ
ncbi:MAG: tetratricopeptide repeat protein [Gemmatimonadaceae bacterium]